MDVVERAARAEHEEQTERRVDRDDGRGPVFTSEAEPVSRRRDCVNHEQRDERRGHPPRSDEADIGGTQAQDHRERFGREHTHERRRISKAMHRDHRPWGAAADDVEGHGKEPESKPGQGSERAPARDDVPNERVRDDRERRGDREHPEDFLRMRRRGQANVQPKPEIRPDERRDLACDDDVQRHEEHARDAADMASKDQIDQPGPSALAPPSAPQRGRDRQPADECRRDRMHPERSAAAEHHDRTDWAPGIVNRPLIRQEHAGERQRQPGDLSAAAEAPVDDRRRSKHEQGARDGATDVAVPALPEPRRHRDRSAPDRHRHGLDLHDTGAEGGERRSP